MKTALARTARCIPALAILFACAAGAVAPAAPGLSTVTTILWLLGLGGAICLLLRRAIDADDRARELAAQLAREREARQLADGMLQETQAVLSRVVRQQDTMRDSERDRIACDIHEDLGQALLSLRIELSLLQVASKGIHPAVHQKTGAMVGTLDEALRTLRTVVNGLRPLGANEQLHPALLRQLEEFTRLSGIAHTFDAGAPVREAGPSCPETDALLYRVLQEALADIAGQASATEVRVRLQRAGAELVLCIEHDGLAAPGPRMHCGCGLAGMRARVDAFGGALQVAASTGCGTKLTLRLPGPHGMVAA